MEHSLLIVGHSDFCRMIEARAYSLGGTLIVCAHTLSEAGLELQAQPTALMVLQAAVFEPGQDCLQLRSRAHFQWTYTLVVEGVRSGLVEDADVSGSPASPEARAKRIAELLGSGADAAVWVDLEPSWTQDSPQDSPQNSPGNTMLLAPAFERLLEAHIQVGWAASSRYRELLQTNDFLSSIALIDPLTELNNRRALDWDLPRQIKRARSGDRPLSLLIFDLDYFKKINDTHGHLVGDVSLKLLSARLRHNLRSNDTLFRYGGEEFVVLLSDTTPPKAREIAQRLCHTIGNQAFTISDRLELSLTVSVGLADLRDSDDAQGISLLERADYRLRQAKQAGRNRVVTGQS